MEFRSIGSLKVSVVGLGCNNFGRRIDEAATKLVVDAALAAGVNFLDTADIYGGTKSEEYLGRVLKGRRDKVVLATKFGMEIDPQRKGAKPDYVKQACADSLKRLQTDFIDLYQLHRPDPEVPIEETLGTLDDLVKEGKVREIGCSFFTPEQLREADGKARGAKFVSVQNQFSMLHRQGVPEVLEACRRLGMAFIPFFPLESGLLSGKYRKGRPAPEGTRIQDGSDKLSEANLDIVERLISFAESKGHTILELAISWLLAHEPVATVIAGATKPEQVRANASAGGWRLSAEEIAEVGRLLG